VTVPQSPRPRREALGCLLELGETLVLTVLIFLGIQTFVAQPYQIQQMSMEQTLLPDQYVLVDKLTPRWAAYERGDIVVFHPPASIADPDKTPFIKRVIGLPGEKVELKDGTVFVNGVALDEPYIFTEDGVRQPTEEVFGGDRSWVVPDGQLFLLGDHRQESVDSRVFGPVPIDTIIGRAWLRYWPADTFGVLAKPAYEGIAP
jgi:signal peptidase I